MSHTRISVAIAATLFLLIVAGTASAQDPFTTYRFDEVGPRTFSMDEEAFLNILSYKQPIESEIPWSRSDRGYQIALGSLDQSRLWHDQELRLRVPVSSGLSVMVHAVGSVDFDSYYTLIQPVVEWHIAEGFEVLIPVSVEFDKGYADFGLGARWRAPDLGVEYLQLSWIRAGALFGSHKADYDTTTVNSNAESFEFQGMMSFGDLGTSKLKVVWLAPSSFTYEEEGETDEYEGFKANWVHQAYLASLTHLFLEFNSDLAEEALVTDDPVNPDEFEGNRKYYQGRVETHFYFDEESQERIRAGLQYLYFYTDEELPNDPEASNTINRRELTLFGGYRYPFTEVFSLEGIIYAMGRNSSTRYPDDAVNDERYDERFQAKLSLYLRWEINESSFFALTPSFELDSFGWGGGGFQLVYNF